MNDADLVALKKASPLIKEMLVAVDKELYARAEVRAVEGVRLVEGRNQRSWNADDDTGCIYASECVVCVCFTTPFKCTIFTPLASTIVIYSVWNFINCLYDLFLKTTDIPWIYDI
jgi:hypothetical protein